MHSRKLWVVAGIFLGLILIGLAASIFLGRRTASLEMAVLPPTYPTAPAEAGDQTTQVIVALQPIAEGSVFVPGSVGRRDWPANNVPPDIIADESETAGKIAKTSIVQGQVIVRSMLLGTGAEDASAPEAVEQTTIGYMAQVQATRVIIYSGQMWLVVGDTQEAIETITRLVEEKGGYISESSVYQSSNNVLQGSITLRVPSEHYQETLAELRALALQVQREESRTQEVTEEYIDQEARLTSLRAGEAAMQELLEDEAQSSAISDIAAVQQQLAQIRAQIEQTEGRLRFLTNQAVLSTIRVELIPETLPPTPTPTPTPIPGWAPGEVVQEASRSLVFSLQRAANTIIWAVIFIPLIIVYLIPVGIVFWLVRWAWRRF